MYKRQGQYLIGHLVAEGAKVMVSDIDPAKIKSAVEKYRNIEVVDNASIFDIDICLLYTSRCV